MKKHKLAAVVGTLALTANLILPGLAFGQTPQQGDLEIGCNTTSPSFSVTPSAEFNFTTTGTGTAAVTSGSTVVPTFSDPAGGLDNGVDTPAGTENRFLEVQDVRDYKGDSDPLNAPDPDECLNDGFTVNVAAIDQAGFVDGVYFDAAPGVNSATDNYIPLDNVMLVTSASGGSCPAAYTGDNGLCFHPDTLCQDGVADACAGSSLKAPQQTASTAFATATTFTTVSAELGTDDNAPVSVQLMNIVDAASVYGKVGLGVAYYSVVPTFQASGTYQLNLEYTVTDTP